MSTEVERVLAEAVRAHLAEAKSQVVSLPRAGAGIRDEDARQLVHTVYQALLDDLAGESPEHKTAFLLDAIPACKATGVSCDTLVKGVARCCAVLLADVAPEIQAGLRQGAGARFGEFVGRLLCELIEAYARDAGA